MATAMGEFDTAVATMSTDAAAARRALGRMERRSRRTSPMRRPTCSRSSPRPSPWRTSPSSRPRTPRRTRPNVFLPWMLDDAPDEDLAFFTGHMPPPVREQLDSEWTPNWRKSVEALRVHERVASS